MGEIFRSETFDWFKPAPMWQENGRELVNKDNQIPFRKPQLLQFATDDFMDEFFTLAAKDQWEEPPLAENPSFRPSEPLKLFQPAHGRFYLVCGSLCCLTPGFPDRAVRLAEGESIFFVLRRCLGDKEWAWVTDGEETGWKSLEDDNMRVCEGEERLPLFTAPTGNGRTLVYGYLPVASRETYAATKDSLAGGDTMTTDPRLAELEGRFISQVAWLNQLEGDQDDIALRLSIYAMLDLWEFLYEELPDVADAIEAGESLEEPEKAAALISWMEDQELDPALSFFQALSDVANARDSLNTASDTDFDEDQIELPSSTDLYTLYQLWPDLSPPDTDLDDFRSAVEAALAEADEAAGEDKVEPTVVVPKLRQDTSEKYVLRCAYERPHCQHQTTWISQASAEFQLASFFDPDAPVRPVSIPLPDVNMSTLRRFGKGVAFIMPPSLQQKMGSVAGLEIDLLTQGPGLTELGLGYFCTFSIPIITLCAFILLMIIAVLLHLVFWWLPFFRICLPVPEPSS